MRINLFLAVAAAAAIAAAQAASAWGELPAETAGLISFWDFNGSLKDLAGSARGQLVPRGGRVRFVDGSKLPGTVAGAAALGVGPGDVQYLAAPLSEDVQLGPNYTIEAWVQPTQLAVWNRLVLHWGNEPDYAYHLGIHNGRLSLYHGQADGTLVFVEGGRIEPGRWYHVAAVARRSDVDACRGTLTVYLDGRPVAAAAFDGTVRTLAAEGLGVGDSAGSPSPGCRYRGYLDELAVWNRALSAEQIRAHYATRAELLRGLELARRKIEMGKRAKAFARFKEFGVEEIVFAERAAGRDPSGHYYANFGYSCIDPSYWIHGRDGGRLCKLNVGTGELTVLVDEPCGAVRDPRVHYDAKKLLFSYRKGGSGHYNLYEINTDGTGLRQITGGPWDDVEPTYLPDGDIIFCSTRCKRWIGCWLSQAAILHRCDAAGGNIRMISSGAFTENTPAILPDGRVLYTRWEYVNRDPVSFHHLWTMRPDGSAQMVYFGNMYPGGVFIDAEPIPGAERVVLIHSPGHGRNEHAGNVAMVSDKSGPDARSGMNSLTRSGGFRDPYPLSEDAFLAAKGNQILWISSNGETEVVYTGSEMVHEPRPVVRRPRERIIPPQADLTETGAELVLADVYAGRSMRGVQRGTIKRLLVLEELPKPANFHGGGSQPIGHGVTSTLKRILGTVAVEADGSAYFKVPPMRSVYFAALDENNLSVKQMRSFVTLQPGERTGCVGCHEPRTQTPGSRSLPTLKALGRPASPIQPIEDVPAVMDFPRDIQPILDRHCVRCHGHQKRDGGVSLVGDRGPVFSHSYYELLLHWQVKDTGGDPRHGSGRQPGNDKPYTTYSFASPLMKKIDGSHYDVKPTPRERKLVRLWIDTSAQYAGTYAAYGTGQIGGCWGNNRPVRVMADRWPSTLPAVDAVERRCGACHPKGQIPRHVTDRIPLDPWGDMLSWVRPLSRYSRHRLYNLTHPEKSLILLASLSRKAGGYADDRPESRLRDPRPVKEDRGRPPRPVVHPIVFTDTGDPDYGKILAHIQAAKSKLDEIKRFDMPGFRPNQHYVREMQRYGILPDELPGDARIDVYATDQAYWRSLWHRPDR